MKYLITIPVKEFLQFEAAINKYKGKTMKKKHDYKIGDLVALKDDNLYIIDEISGSMARCVRYGKYPKPSLDNTFNTKYTYFDEIVKIVYPIDYLAKKWEEKLKPTQEKETESEFADSIVRITNELNDLKLECIKLIDENSQLKKDNKELKKFLNDWVDEFFINESWKDKKPKDVIDDIINGNEIVKNKWKW
jgi:regulator of replication initiation timing